MELFFECLACPQCGELVGGLKLYRMERRTESKQRAPDHNTIYIYICNNIYIYIYLFIYLFIYVI